MIPVASTLPEIGGHRDKVRLPRDVAGAFIIVALLAVFLLAIRGRDYPELHTILDTAVFLMSAILALLLWEASARLDRAFLLWLAVSFTASAALEFIHVMAAVDYTGALAPLAGLSGFVRPATWPPSVHVLPIGIGAAVLLLLRGEKPAPWLAPILALVTAVLFACFQYLPTYTPAGLFGITRPALVLAPLLWLSVGAAAWRWRDADRMMRPIACMAAIVVFANIVMLYSEAPHDAPAMAAHLGKAAGRLILLYALMRMASLDTLERARAERALATLNEELETRVRDRTIDLTVANRRLEGEISERRLAERRAIAQLQRLNLLHQITRAIGERQDLASIFQVAIRSVEDELPADFSCLFNYEPMNALLTSRSFGAKNTGLAASLISPAWAEIDVAANGLSHCVQGALVYESDLAQLEFPLPRLMTQHGLGSVVFAPLQVESSAFGVFVVGRAAANAFSSGECEFLRQLSEHVALAVHQAQLIGALRLAYDDLRQTQQAVTQQERLRALGQMASGIAHDINNSLTPASLYTETLLEDATLGEDARAMLRTVHLAIDDVAHTIARMREFYREPETQAELSEVALNDLIRQVVDLTRPSWSNMAMQRGAVIAVTPDLAAELPRVLGVESEIREALINVVLNAVDALPEGGAIQIRTGVAVTGFRQFGDQVRVEIVDNGAGMTEDTRIRCLEPFFTTKGERGTGLGLAMVYGVMQRHRGAIEIDSAPKQGTTMRLLFPVSDPAQSPTAAQAPESRPAVRLNLLLVDDDPLLLKALQDTLEVDGHMVEAVNGGQAGIDAFRAATRSGKRYAAVVTDLGMPNVDGRKVAAAVKAESSDTPVILLTGWGQRLIAEGDLPADVDLVLSKPPKLRDLRRALARLCPPVT